jgi:hypothetical protein
MVLKNETSINLESLLFLWDFELEKYKAIDVDYLIRNSEKRDEKIKQYNQFWISDYGKIIIGFNVNCNISK